MRKNRILILLLICFGIGLVWGGLLPRGGSLSELEQVFTEGFGEPSFLMKFVRLIRLLLVLWFLGFVPEKLSILSLLSVLLLLLYKGLSIGFTFICLFSLRLGYITFLLQSCLLMITYFYIAFCSLRFVLDSKRKTEKYFRPLLIGTVLVILSSFIPIGF